MVARLFLLFLLRGRLLLGRLLHSFLGSLLLWSCLLLLLNWHGEKGMK